jgi:hypothetical protein
MKKSVNALILASIIGLAACGSSQNSNENASDTTTILDSTQLNSAPDTNAANNSSSDTAKQSASQSQYEESTGKQAPRTNVGTDTTGKQEHDNGTVKPAGKKP